MQASIQEVARLAGTTSRTLRHYDAVGLLPPSRVAANGYRWYDEDALVRLQRILLLRRLGLGLGEIARVLDEESDELAALRRHLTTLRTEQQRLSRLVATVERTITARENGEPLMADELLDGFDHTTYREEVERRWGADAYARSDAWWRGMPDDERASWQERTGALNADWAAAAQAGTDPASPQSRALAERHVAWLRSIPGTPAHDHPDALVGYVLGLADMYVADERFAAAYGGPQGAAFVRAALQEWAADQPDDQG